MPLSGEGVAFGLGIGGVLSRSVVPRERTTFQQSFAAPQAGKTQQIEGGHTQNGFGPHFRYVLGSLWPAHRCGARMGAS